MKKICRLLLIMGCLLSAGQIYAQQDPMYSQYMFNMLPINPAFTGSRETLSLTALYRKQWVGIEGAPSTFNFTADTPIRNQRMALGLNVISDKIGITSNTMINLSYAYRIRFVNDGIMSFGIQAGVNQYSADYSSVNTSPSFQAPGQTDYAFAGSMKRLLPNFGFGVYYHTQKFYLGLASPKMIKNNLAGENRPTLDFTSYANRQNRHLFLATGYDFDLRNDITLKPSLLIKQVYGAPLEFDINVNAYWKKLVGAGLSYRSADAVIVMLEFQAKPEFHIGYAYDMTLSKLSGTNSGSHEVMLRYEPYAKKLLKAKRSRLGYNKRPANKRKSSYKSSAKRKKTLKRRSRRIG